LNYYRNCDRNWELTPFLDGAKVLQPTLFLTGEKDPVLDFLGQEFAALPDNVPNSLQRQDSGLLKSSSQFGCAKESS